MAYTAGADVGSTQTKPIVINEAKNIVGRALGAALFALDHVVAGRAPAATERPS